MLTEDQLKKLLAAWKAKSSRTAGTWRCCDCSSTRACGFASDQPQARGRRSRQPRCHGDGQGEAPPGVSLRRQDRGRPRPLHPHRARSHWVADTDALWIGNRGAMTTAGIRSLVERRANKAGIGHVHAHLFRHSFAHQWLKEGGGETDLMRLVGWRSREMLGRYAASAADDRAHAAYQTRSQATGCESLDALADHGPPPPLLWARVVVGVHRGPRSANGTPLCRRRG